MPKKNILITGCAGFIGSSLANYLSKNDDYIIWGVDNLSRGDKKSLSKKVKFIKGDCESDIVLNKIKKKKFFAILHFAGQSSGEVSYNDPLKDFNDNLHTTIKLLTFAEKIKIKHFIFASSMGVYGDRSHIHNENIYCSPKSFYGTSKLASENYIKIFQKRGLNTTILRLFNVYGPGQKLNSLKQGMIRIYFNQILKKKFLLIKGSKKRTRDFIYIDDVVKIISFLIGNTNAFNKVLNVCTGKSYSISKLIKKIKNVVNIKFKTKYVSGTPLDQNYISASNRELKKIIKICKFVSLDDGLKRFYLNLSKSNRN